MANYHSCARFPVHPYWLVYSIVYCSICVSNAGKKIMTLRGTAETFLTCNVSTIHPNTTANHTVIN